jgi:hypothetical protein
VSASSVVELQPGGKRGGTVGVAEEDLPVGPFDLQCAVEPLDFSVLPRAVRLDEPVLNAELGNRLLDGGGVPVGPGVVGDQPLKPGNPVGGEVGGNAEQEPRTGGADLVGEDLGLGEPGVVVD